MKTIHQTIQDCREHAGRIRSAAQRLHRDEQGAEGLEKLLIVAVIVLPLLGLLILFRDRINTWVNNEWQGAIDTDTDNPIDQPAQPPNSGNATQ